jgi:glycosyltransferase involved in cell wall biosynthesis
MGFLRQDKGLDVVVKALETLKDFDATLVVGGETKNREVEKLINKLIDSGCIFIEKYFSNEEILMLASLADVILLPYKDNMGTYSVSVILH